MENEEQNTPASEPQMVPKKSAPESPKQKSGMVIGLSILVLILLGTNSFFAYHYFQSQSSKEPSQPTVKRSPIVNLTTPTPDNWYTEQISSLTSSDTIQAFEGGLEISKESYRITILPGWAVKRKQTFANKQPAGDEVLITLDTNPDYVIRIAQGGFSGFRCVYPEGIIREDSNDQLFQNYVEVVDQDKNNYRRAIRGDNIPEGREGSNTYYVCEYVAMNDGYYFPTRTYEHITYTTPDPVDNKTLIEMDQMLASIKNISEDE